ncbi:ABC transporter permease [Sporolactobacillus shoreae]|uniref:ABC transporter permease n=1 Tax=Sporolactobacillus shoreae TaxID=1465501 RepID=A0A4Z0GLT3_9BACL|nr:ABC transporter permease [Sporolactobacillus shoreae]TGA97971.1 ABC transporter permease [Sporolactobacillus shoreae]
MKNVMIKEFKLMLKERGNVFFLIILPLLFIVAFGSIFNSAGSTSITIHVHDLDRTAASQAFVKQIDRLKGFTVKKENSPSVASQVKKIKDGSLSSLIVIDKGFETGLQKGGVPIHFYQDGAQSSSAAPIQAILQNMANQYREQKLAQTLSARGLNPAQIKQTLAAPIHIQTITENGKHIDFMSQIVPGYTVMFVFFIMISMLQRFFKERDSGMIARLQGTPLRSAGYLVGMWIPPFVSVLIQCAVLLFFGRLFYGLHLGNPVVVTLIVLCLAFCGTGLGLGLSMIARSQNQGIGITQLITMGGAIVAGLWFPSDMLPSFVQNIGYFTPQYWAMQGFQDVMIRDAGLSAIWLNLLLLLVFGVFGLAIALFRFRPFIHDAAH